MRLGGRAPLIAFCQSVGAACQTPIQMAALQIYTLLMIKSKGFTLVELLVVIAVVAVLTTLAAPSFKALLQSNSMSSSVNTFMADLRYARSEAIRRGGWVVMCRSNLPEAANPTCSSGSTVGWESGWIIFHDENNNGQKASAEPLLRAQGPVTSVDTISESGAATVFRFTATGRLNLAASTSIQFGSNSTFANTVQRIVCVNLSGRARIAGDGTSSCSTDQ